MSKKQFKTVAESEHFIYFVTEEDENKNWCLKTAIKDNFANNFDNYIVDEISQYKVILKTKLAIRHQANYMKLNAYSDSPYKMKDLEPQFRKEIKKTIIDTYINYSNEQIPYYDYAVVLWEELNDKEKFFLYETPNREFAWLTTPFSKEQTGLAMNIELAIQTKDEPPYLIVQNDYEDKHNLNWIKVQLNGTAVEDKKFIFKEHELRELKTWIEVNKLPILMYWTKEEHGSREISELIKTLKVIEPIQEFKSNDWQAKQIAWAKDLEKYFDSVKDKIIGKSIDKIFYTGNLFNQHWDEFFEYHNGEWYQNNIKVDEPDYYPWKESNTKLLLDSPVIFDFEGTKLEIDYHFGSLVKANTNSVDVNIYGADVSKHFARHIIGQKLVDIQIHKRNDVYFMNFEHIGIERNEGDDMFQEIWFIFENGYKLELTTNHCDYTILCEVK